MLNPLEQEMLGYIRDALRNKEGMSEVEARRLRAVSGDPLCERCGWCCKKAPCLYAVHLHGDDVERCPELQHLEDGRSVCRAYETASEEMRPVLRLVLSVGCGCGGWFAKERDLAGGHS